MDTIIIVVLMTGASLMMVLLFASTVLSFKWWKLLSTLWRKRRDIQLKKSDRKRKHVLLHAETKVRSQSHNLVQFKRISSLNELINKEVKTCEMVDVGHVIAIDKYNINLCAYTPITCEN